MNGTGLDAWAWGAVHLPVGVSAQVSGGLVPQGVWLGTEAIRPRARWEQAAQFPAPLKGAVRAGLGTPQYTSRTYRFSAASCFTYAAASASPSPPWATAMSRRARSTSLAMREASPQT